MAIRRVTRAGVGLVVGIIILAALVFAGLWFVRERGEQTRRDEAINIAEQQLQDMADDEVAIDVDESESTTETETAPSDSETRGATTDNAPAATELPQTGPEVTPILAAGILTFAAVSFARSRKSLF